jgi:hypothetical protein
VNGEIPKLENKITGEFFFSKLKTFLALTSLDALRDLVSRNLLVLAKGWASGSFTAFLTDFLFTPSSWAMPFIVYSGFLLTLYLILSINPDVTT